MAVRLGTKRAVTVAVAVTLAACGVSGVEEDAWNDPLAGEWIACLNDGGTDHSRRMYFYADSFSSTVRTYATTDGTCGGAPTGVNTEIWRFALGPEVPAQVGPAGTEVLARELNLQNSTETLFTIVFVDETATPRLLYFGDLAGDPLQDGTSPDKRPDLLAPTTALMSP